MNTRVLSLGLMPVVGLMIATPFKPARIARVAELHTARAAHTATTLPSGDVLLAGGMVGGGASTASVELYDAARNSLSEIGSLAHPRSGHTATLLPNGRVIIAGGFDGAYLTSVEVFDPATRRLRNAGALHEGRSGHTATLLGNGRILITGGVGRGWTFLRSAEIYDPATGTSETVGSLTVPRESHTATLLQDGRVLIVGGHNGRRENMTVYASAELFSLRTKRFESAASLGTARHKHDALRLADGRVLVVGGADRTDRGHFATTEVYDPDSGRFVGGPSMASTRYKIAGTSVLLRNGDVLVTSGARVAERLDIKRWTFRPVDGTLDGAFHFAAVATLRNGDVLISGGYSDSNRNTGGVWRFRTD